MTDSKRWAAVTGRDRAADGTFVFAVKTTGIFCRPSCPARRPRRANVRFYAIPEAAEADGFRACRRCSPREMNYAGPGVRLVRQVTAVLDRDHSATLRSLADAVGRSPSHVQRTFQSVLGVSPRTYGEMRRRASIKARLRSGRSVTEAQYESGLSSSSRLYEGSDGWLGMTPNRYRNGGAGAEIRFGFGRTSLGQVLVAATTRGVCAVRIGTSRRALELDLRAEFPEAEVRREDTAVDVALTRILEAVEGGRVPNTIDLDIQATAFQARVWRALMAIPSGETRTYLDVARSIGQPDAFRAVANACAANPVAVVIPCHRVVRTDGGMGGYRWGLERKEELLAREARHP